MQVPSVPIHDSFWEWSRGCLGPWGGGREGGNQTKAQGGKGSFQSSPASEQSFTPFLTQEKPPYNLRAFNLRINFPEEYPMRPPTVTFTTKIYHPNVGVDGQVCLPIISNENWKPSTKTYQGGLGSASREGAHAGEGLWG